MMVLLNKEKMKKKIKKWEVAPGVVLECPYECQKCGASYGRRPPYCHACGSTRIKNVKDES